MDIKKVKVTLLANEGENYPFTANATIIDEAGNSIICYWPIDIHIDGKDSYVILRMNAEVEVEGKPITPEEFIIRTVEKAQKEKRL